MPRDPAVHFFFKHAGYSYNPQTETPLAGRWRGAHALADAEREAHARGWSFDWEWDDEPDIAHDMDGLPAACLAGTCAGHEVLGCILRTSVDRHAASLWGIVDPSSEYRRVVEAELASEHLAAIQAEAI